MKKIIEFTKNWKHRNLLHVLGGFLMGAFLSLLFAWYISLVLIITFANYWEFCQKKDFGAKYSISDILLTTLGGVVAIGLVHFFTYKYSHKRCAINNKTIKQLIMDGKYNTIQHLRVDSSYSLYNSGVKCLYIFYSRE